MKHQKHEVYVVIDTDEKAKQAYEILTKAGEEIDNLYGTEKYFSSRDYKPQNCVIHFWDNWIGGGQKEKDTKHEITLSELAEMLGERQPFKIGIGDAVKFEHEGAEYKGFVCRIQDKDIYVVDVDNGDEFGVDPSKLISRPLLLRSEDGYNLYEGDEYWRVCLTAIGNAVDNKYRLKCLDAVISDPDFYKAFKSREKAESWVAYQNGLTDKDKTLIENHPAPTQPYTPNQLEYFAGLALQGLCANYLREDVTGWDIQAYAVESVALAKALITELKKKEQG